MANPWILAQKVVLKVRRTHKRVVQRTVDKRRTSYGPMRIPTHSKLNHFFEIPPVHLLIAHRDQILALSENYLAHRFDLLGSGWVQVRHGMVCRGLEGHLFSAETITTHPDGRWLHREMNAANLEESVRRWKILYRLNPSYIPIDWQLDFKSGYRWSTRTWSPNIAYGNKPGVDVKVPWELARMQHLPQFAWSYALNQDSRSLMEFQSQILDFIATNPPRFGVNWVCTMDVAIRVANWLAAYDLFRAQHATFDPAFERLFIQAIYEHAWHIRHYLEWSPDIRGNHYLADIVGLLFTAAYLPDTPDTKSWFALASKELLRETEQQFYREGTNIESSTSYHRLSAEMCFYGTALALRRGVVLSKDHFQRIAAISQFTEDLMKSDGHVPQIGDNDNGRFFKFFPVFHRNTFGDWQEDHLDHRRSPTETSMIHTLAGSDFTTFAVPELRGTELSHKSWDILKKQFSDVDPSCVKCFIHPAVGSDFLTDLKIRTYPQFGIYIFRSKRLYLAVRCGHLGRSSGHAHNDQLSMELQIDGQDIFCDPGSFVYTALPDIRNEYRSIQAHSGPQGVTEPARLDQGLFVLNDRSKAECLYWGKNGFIGRHYGFGSSVTRLIELSSNGIHVLDVYEDKKIAEAASSYKPPPFSPGYGLRNPRKTS